MTITGNDWMIGIITVVMFITVVWMLHEDEWKRNDQEVEEQEDDRLIKDLEE